MKLWKKLTSLLLAAAMMVPFAAAAPSEEGSFSDVDGHWAQAEIEQAVATGWVDGYPDESFKPEKSITRAEFTKMLLDAIHLTPGCETVNWMVEHAKIQVKGTGPWGTPNTVDYEPNLNDMDTHWLTTQGWTEAALYSGMVVPSDYNNGNFRPEKPIARYEIALMVTRALGQVYEAKAEEGLDITLPFTDSETTLSWMKGYIRVASEAGVVKGYPDGSFQPNEASTRAEAVVMVQRMLDEMEQGLDPEITVVAQYRHWEDGETFTLERAADNIRLQVVDNVVYASLPDMYEVRAEIMREVNTPYDVYEDPDQLDERWWPVEQCVDIANGLGIFEVEDHFQMGSTSYYMSGTAEQEFCAPVRALYGEVMLPVCDLNHPSEEAQDLWQSGWDPETNTLSGTATQPGHYTVTLSATWNHGSLQQTAYQIIEFDVTAAGADYVGQDKELTYSSGEWNIETITTEPVDPDDGVPLAWIAAGALAVIVIGLIVARTVV